MGAETRHATGLRRSARLVRLYRREPVDPAPFYEYLARDTIEQLRPHVGAMSGLVVDVGGGPGYLADAVRAEGASCVVVDYRAEELLLHERTPHTSVVGDGRALPLRAGAADVVHCSNVLEHVPEPTRLLGEVTRVLRPGGVGYLAFTPWLSPWGGHETSPWHYLGGERAAARYERRSGQAAKNRYGTSLFRLHIAPVRRWFADNSEVRVRWEGPRYWPPSWRWIARAGPLGEALAWNFLVIFERVER